MRNTLRHDLAHVSFGVMLSVLVVGCSKSENTADTPLPNVIPRETKITFAAAGRIQASSRKFANRNQYVSLATVASPDTDAARHVVVIQHLKATELPAALAGGSLDTQGTLKYDGDTLVFAPARGEPLMFVPAEIARPTANATVHEVERILSYRTNGKRSHKTIAGDLFSTPSR
jgi:hypothetical protein